jgi:hypothetical protein
MRQDSISIPLANNYATFPNIIACTNYL